jgi:hypothetical protein
MSIRSIFLMLPLTAGIVHQGKANITSAIGNMQALS